MSRKTAAGDIPASGSDAVARERAQTKALLSVKRQELKEEKPILQASSTSSSPPRRPYLRRTLKCLSKDGFEIYEPVAGKDMRLYLQEKKRYERKLASQEKLPTLNPSIISCFGDPALSSLCKSVKQLLINVSKRVVRVCSYDGDKMICSCSGILMDCDLESKTGIVLTCAKVSCLQSAIMELSGKNSFPSDLKISVQLLDGTFGDVLSVYWQWHFNLAFIKIKMDQPQILPCFNTEEGFSNVAIFLGRKDNLNLEIIHSLVHHQNGPIHHRNHYVYATKETPLCIMGGPVLDCQGRWIGVTIHTRPAAFIPSSILQKCVDLWKRVGKISRPHAGLKVWSIEYLGITGSEMLDRMCKIHSGLICMEVAEDSVAEKNGIKTGDIIQSLNGHPIADTIEFENYLLSMGMEHIKEGNDNDMVSLELGVFHVRSGSKGNIKLTLQLSDKAEVFPCLAELAQGTCLPIRKKKVETPNDESSDSSSSSREVQQQHRGPFTKKEAETRKVESSGSSSREVQQRQRPKCLTSWPLSGTQQQSPVAGSVSQRRSGTRQHDSIPDPMTQHRSGVSEKPRPYKKKKCN